MASTLAGKLLVATPEMLDPNFARSVILLLEHEPEEGALGLVLNRPADLDPSDQLPEWAPLFDPPEVFLGGPVTPEIAVGLADTPGQPVESWSPVVGNIGLVDLGASPESVGGALRVRVWAGYSGWTEGQLEAELTLRSWFVVDAEPGDVFTNRPESLWGDVLRRQPGRLSWYANFPADLRLN